MLRDLRIPEGAICSVMGPSGTGKSVLIKHILGLLKPDAGEVLVRGRSLNKMSRSEVIASPNTGCGESCPSST